MKLISVIVPIYNVEKFLDRCVESIVKQTYSNLEIILVDDGSPDLCPILCEQWAEKDKRIKVIHKCNGGLSDARNCGLINATGEYILFVDSDDYLALDACETLLQGMISEEVSFVVGASAEVREGKQSIARHSAIIDRKEYEAREFIITAIKNNEWYAPAWLNLYRKSYLIDNQLLFKKGRFFEDMEILPRMYLQADKIVYVDHVFYYYMIRENSIMTSKKNQKKQSDAIANYDEWKALFDTINDKQLQKKLYGVLIKCFLKTCREYEITTWSIEGVNFKFAIRNGLNLKENMKVIYFSLFPRLYVRNKR